MWHGVTYFNFSKSLEDFVFLSETKKAFKINANLRGKGKTKKNNIKLFIYEENYGS